MLAAMDSRLKERLTGAAILVATIVLLVPAIFRGQRGNDAVPAAAAGADGAPLRSYTIDLSNNPKGSGPMQSTAESASTQPAEATPLPAPVALPPPTMPVIAPTQASASPPPPAANVPASKTRNSRSPPSARPAAVAAAPAPPPVPAPAPPPVKSAVAAGWGVQLGLFSKRDNAERLAGEARGKGFPVSISESRGQFRVRATGLADRASAQSLAQRLKGGGFTAAVIAP
jgi:DedD protein